MKKTFALYFFLMLVISQLVFAKNAFVIGSDNGDDAIKNLTELTGLSIKEIEDRARPCDFSKWPKCSSTGFLGKDESLISCLLSDNKFVHSKKLTHDKIASVLFTVLNLPVGKCKRKNPKEVLSGGECSVNGNTYKVTFEITAGFQESVFNDSLNSSYLVVVYNPQTNERMEFADILPAYIQRYGFYEGKTPYRLAPEAIIRMFKITE